MTKFLNKKRFVSSFYLLVILICALLIVFLAGYFLIQPQRTAAGLLLLPIMVPATLLLIVCGIILLATEKTGTNETGNIPGSPTASGNSLIEDLQNEKKYFASILSHDLRSPLSSIVLLASYLKSKDENPEALRYIELIEQSTRKELDLMATLLSLMRVESFKSDQAEELPLHLTVAEILKNAESQLTKKQVEAAIDIAPDLSIFANPQSLNLILKTLIGQAICFSDEGKIIEIKAAQDNQSVVIEVALLSEELRKNAGAQLFLSSRLSLHHTGNSFPECIPFYFLEKAIGPYNGTIRVQRDDNNPTSRFILTLERLQAPYTS